MLLFGKIQPKNPTRLEAMKLGHFACPHIVIMFSPDKLLLLLQQPKSR